MNSYQAPSGAVGLCFATGALGLCYATTCLMSCQSLQLNGVLCTGFSKYEFLLLKTWESLVHVINFKQASGRFSFISWRFLKNV